MKIIEGGKKVNKERYSSSICLTDKSLKIYKDW